MLAVAGLWLAITIGATAAATGAQEKPAATFSPAQLLAEPFPVDARLGAALARAVHGDFDGAATAAGELAKAGAPTGAAPPALGGDRLERERSRLLALAAARRELLDRCVKEQKKLHFKQGDKSLGGTVVEATEEKIVLADAKGKRFELPLAALDPEEFLKRMAELKLESGSATTRAFAALLAGRKNWAKGLEGSGEAEAAALKSDAAGFAALIATGEAARALEELGHAPLPAAAPPANAALEGTLAAIKSLLADHGREPIVVARRPLLRQLAGAVLATRFDARGIAGAGLKGEVAPSPDGTVRLTYVWKTLAGLDDFVASDAQHPSWSLFEIKLPKAQWKRTLDEETLCLFGQGCLRHRVEFEAPVAIEYEVEYGAPIKEMSTFSTLRAALCDDGQGTMVTNLDLESVDAYQHARRILDSSDPGETKKEIATRIAYQVRLEDDGKEAKLLVADRPEQKIAAPKRAGGGVALYWKTDAPVKLTKLVIEGRIARDGLAALREAAVAKDLTALFGD